MTPVLHQFAFSHFNEKARWAFAYKGIDCERRTYLPGPHMPAIRKLSGQTATPVLQLSDRVIAGSSPIMDWLESEHPEPPLYPADPAERDAALRLRDEFDAEVGPPVRTVIFSGLLDAGSYLASMFGADKSGLKRVAYRLSFPLARPLIARANGVAEPGNVERSFQRTREALDRVASQAAATGYLIGSGFSVADLTAAALLAPIADVDHPDMRRPRPVPARVAEIIAGFASHPGVAWVNEIYARHR